MQEVEREEKSGLDVFAGEAVQVLDDKVTAARHLAFIYQFQEGGEILPVGVLPMLAQKGRLAKIAERRGGVE